MTANPLMQALAAAKMQEASPFGKWCLHKNVRALPAAPAHVAAFVRDCEPLLPVRGIWDALQDISQAHLSNGLADPTAGGVVAEAINAIAEIAPPRSWPDPMKARFKSLPYDVQAYVSNHEDRRDREIRRAQNDAALARNELKKIQQPAETSNGKPENAAA